MLHKDFAENLKQYHSHMDDHSLAKLRKQPLFRPKVCKKESSPTLTNFFASHQICGRDSSTDWETEDDVETYSTLFNFRSLKVKDVSDESD